MSRNGSIEELVDGAKATAAVVIFVPYVASLASSITFGLMEGYSTAKGAPACGMSVASGAASSALLLSFMAVESPDLLQKSYGDERLNCKRVGAAIGSCAAISAIAYGAGFVLGKLM